MNNSSGYGSPLRSVSDVLKENPPKLVILFIIDGCRADAFNSVLDNGEMPNLRRLMDDVGYERYEKCVTAFPSVTLTCHSSIMTGAWAGIHGIVGNEWFIRKKWGLYPDSSCQKRIAFSAATREYVKFSIDSKDPGLVNLTGGYFKIADCDLYGTKTLYESFGGTADEGGKKTYTASIYEMISRGAEEKKTIFIDDLKGALKGRIVTWLRAIRKGITGKRYLAVDNKGLDSRAFEELFEHCRTVENRDMRLFTVWLPGMDGFSHTNGAQYQQEYFKKGDCIEQLFLKSMDQEIGKLHTYLKENSLLDQILITVTADHGQYDCNPSMCYSNDYMYRQIKSEDELASDETLPITADGKVDNDCKDATIVIMGNGGACYIYVKGKEGWGNLPDRKQLTKWLTYFERHDAVDKVFVRSDDGKTFSWWKSGAFLSVGELDEVEYPFAEERLTNLGRTMRSGDILLSAKPGYYFAAHSNMKGEHGSLRKEDSCVPLVFISRQLERKENVVPPVRTIDIMPTILASVRKTFHSETVQGIHEKLATLLNTLKTCTGKPDNVAFERTLAAEINDVKVNFEQKLSYYHDNGTITDSELNTFLEQYQQIISGL